MGPFPSQGGEGGSRQVASVHFIAKLGFRYSGSGSGSGSGFRFRSRRDRKSGSVPADALSRPMNVTLIQHVRVARDSIMLSDSPRERSGQDLATSCQPGQGRRPRPD